MEDKLLFRVADNFSLTGLGVLLFPATEVAELLPLALHTALPLTLCHPSGYTETAVGSVEEIARPGTPETRALLLTQPEAMPVPVGTEVWWNGEEAGW